MHRWQEILKAVSLPPTAVMQERRDELERRAAAAEKT
jgi:hypothetical protein